MRCPNTPTLQHSNTPLLHYSNIPVFFMADKRNYLTYTDFLRHLEQGNIKPLYVFQGEETFLMEECLDLVKHTLIQSESVDFNFDKFSAGDVEIGTVLDQAQTMPFLGKRRVIILTDVQNLKTQAQKQMLPYLSDPNSSTCLIMTATRLDNRTKFAQAIKQHGDLVQFWKLFDRDLPRWISRRAKGYGYSISTQTATYLLELVGNDLRQLDNELKKIIAYTNNTEITSDVIQRVVGDIRERDIFELVDAVSTGNIIDALRILNQLLIEGEQPLRILAMVSRQFRLLWKTKACLVKQRDVSAKQLASTVGVSFRLAEALQKQVQRFSQIKLKNALKRLHTVDRALKSSTNSPKILLEDLLIDLCL